MLGLPHPFDFGPVGNFVQTPMSYFTWDYQFGQEDKDSLRRGQVDNVYIGVQAMISQLAQKGGDVGPIFNQLKDADGKYGQMDYVAALQSALKADSMANDLAAKLSQGNQPTLGAPAYFVIGTTLGLVVGLVIAWLLVTKRIRLPAAKARRRK